MYKGLQLVYPFHSFGFHRELKNTVFYGNIGCTRIHRKIQWECKPLTTLQTRTEFAKRQDLPPPENGDRLAQGLFLDVYTLIGQVITPY